MSALELTLRDDLQSVGDAQKRLSQWLLDQRLAPVCAQRTELIFEELATNIAKHAFPNGGDGQNVFLSRLILHPSRLELILEDDGVPFDPRTQAGETLSGKLEDVKIGGLGLILVRKFASRIDYARSSQGRNRLEVDILTGEPGGRPAGEM